MMIPKEHLEIGRVIVKYSYCLLRSKSCCPVSSRSNPAVTCKYLTSTFSVAVEQLHENCCDHLLNTENLNPSKE
ncbi:hypothetical protein AV530_003641 [Patagioenas fasciata monilis]|uniref:Uncharacterized protein n=1 Tax=Patagioenas fasciata monilis TaxID=372326 RepID=A0A1V4KYC8_PATFA|nr:hypothetical protein AV530_003641 [Patagioenas fasciata monilis]